MAMDFIRIRNSCFIVTKPFVVLMVLSIAWGGLSLQADEARTKWDNNLLSLEFPDVSIRALRMQTAWRQITTKYLLRANLFVDKDAESEFGEFVFTKTEATGKEILDALVATYPEYTYTQDILTRVIWIHPKHIQYENILSQIVRVDSPARQVPMYTKVYLPLCELLQPAVTNMTPPSSGRSPMLHFFVDIPIGEHTARSILNYCCIANPTKAFLVSAQLATPLESLSLSVFDLGYLNPLAPPRVAAVRFWEVEVGESLHEIPSEDDVISGLCSTNSHIRWAAAAYLEAAQANYSPKRLVWKAKSSEEAVWVALGIERTLYRGIGDEGFLDALAIHCPRIKNDFESVQEPGLALLACLELAREMRMSSHLDSIAKGHTFSDVERANIGQDIHRLANMSQLVLDKLRLIQPSLLPEVSSEAPSETGRTNLFVLVEGQDN